jgi:hypothetical protein
MSSIPEDVDMYLIKFVSELRQDCSVLWVILFPLPI